jgi:alpha-ribazole phosphatase
MTTEKPTKIFLLRHGDVDLPKKIFYGQMDVPLSETGKEKSRVAAEYISSFGINRIISSDLSRCMYFANAIREKAGDIRKIESFSELRELNFGKWTGLTWDEIEREYPGELTKRYANLAGYSPPDGESLSNVQARVMEIIKNIINNSKQGDNVAIVAHAGVNRCIISNLMGYPLSNFFIVEQDYCCINIIDFYGENAVIKRLNLTI